VEVEVYKPGSLEEAARILQAGLGPDRWLVFFGECFTEYEGRAASRTTPGDMLVIVKPSGAVIVHGPRGFRPLNWQPDTGSIMVRLHEGLLELVAVRRRPREVLYVRCARVHAVMAGWGAREGVFWMFVNEHEIRDFLAENPGLIEEGLRIVETERPVEPGFIDLYGVDREGRRVVVELKRVKAGEEAVRQLLRYLEALRRRGLEARGILVAPDFTEGAVREAERAGVKLVRIDLAGIYERVKARSGGRGAWRTTSRLLGAHEGFGRGLVRVEADVLDHAPPYEDLAEDGLDLLPAALQPLRVVEDQVHRAVGGDEHAHILATILEADVDLLVSSVP